MFRRVRRAPTAGVFKPSAKRAYEAIRTRMGTVVVSTVSLIFMLAVSLVAEHRRTTEVRKLRELTEAMDEKLANLISRGDEKR